MSRSSRSLTATESGRSRTARCPTCTIHSRARRWWPGLSELQRTRSALAFHRLKRTDNGPVASEPASYAAAFSQAECVERQTGRGASTPQRCSHSLTVSRTARVPRSRFARPNLNSAERSRRCPTGAQARASAATTATPPRTTLATGPKSDHDDRCHDGQRRFPFGANRPQAPDCCSGSRLGRSRSP
jgi:hypothetical protein